MNATPAANSPSRGRIIAARILLVLGVLLLVLSILSTYVKREALDSGQFRQTSQQLIADPEIQEAVAAQMTDALANVDFTGSLEEQAADEPAGAREPDRRPRPGLRRHGGARTCSPGRASRTRSSTLACSRRQQFVKVLHGDTKAVDTSNGNVVLDIRPLVLKLGDRFGFVNDLAAKIPQDAGQVTILEADNLDTAQTITHWLEQIANFVWIFALAAWVGAIWLARGRRRQEVRSLGIGLVVVGVLVLLARWLAGKYFVDQIVASDSMRPAAHNAWQIITQSLAAAGWVALVGRHPRRDRRLARRARRPRDGRARRARPAPAAPGDRVGRVRRRDVAAHLAPADPGLPHDRGARRRVRDRLRRLPAPAQGGVAGTGPGRPAATPAPPPRRRRRPSGSAHAAGRQSSQRPCSTTSCARMP